MTELNEVPKKKRPKWQIIVGSIAAVCIFLIILGAIFGKEEEKSSEPSNAAAATSSNVASSSTSTPLSTSQAPTSTAAASFSSCAEAVAAGVAPIRKGEPGYREDWDRDRDGVACETDGDASKATTTTPVAAPAEVIDSGIHGIVVPGSAVNRDQIGESVTFDLPRMGFEEAAQWMGAHLPVDSAVDGMNPCGANRSEVGHSWYWGGVAEEPMLSVTVFDQSPPQVMIHNGIDPVGC